MRKADEQEPEDPRLARGRRQVIAILVTLAGSILLVAFLGGTPASSMAIQLVVLALLGMALFGGAKWARWVLFAFTAIGGAANAWLALTSFGAPTWSLNAGLALVYGWCAFFLAMSAPLRDFIAARRR